MYETDNNTVHRLLRHSNRNSILAVGIPNELQQGTMSNNIFNCFFWCNGLQWYWTKACVKCFVYEVILVSISFIGYGATAIDTMKSYWSAPDIFPFCTRSGSPRALLLHVVDDVADQVHEKPRYTPSPGNKKRRLEEEAVNFRSPSVVTCTHFARVFASTQCGWTTRW